MTPALPEIQRNRMSWEKSLAWSELPAGCRLTGLVVAMYSDDAGFAPVLLSTRDLSRLTGLSMATVRRYLVTLQRKGWLQWHSRYWFLNWPGQRPVAGQAGASEYLP